MLQGWQRLRGIQDLGGLEFEDGRGQGGTGQSPVVLVIQGDLVQEVRHLVPSHIRTLIYVDYHVLCLLYAEEPEDVVLGGEVLLDRLRLALAQETEVLGTWSRWFYNKGEIRTSGQEEALSADGSEISGSDLSPLESEGRRLVGFVLQHLLAGQMGQDPLNGSCPSVFW